ncbi:MAG: hypothetical protein IJH91_02755 [Mogibacterium sp.]|nr:hypothetical protein [Mogibacterium sp.]
MKKSFTLLLMVLLILSSTACHKHTWKEATCTEPKTCTECDETEGEPLGHDWVEATCTTPKTCSRCGATEGQALGHSVVDWEVTKEATCAEKGTKSGKCTVCGQTVEENIPMVDHIPGDWEVTKAPTRDSEGMRARKCTVCGATVESETFSLSEEELKALYISECQSISYDKLERSPGDHEGKKIKFSGYVVQVCSEASSAEYYSTYRVATSGRYDNVIYVRIDNYGKGSRILEDDYITLYGTYDGLYTYTTVRGDSLSIPQMTAEYYE